MKMMAITIVLGLTYFSAVAKTPDCSGKDNWPATMAFVRLKNSGITDNAKVDFTKTTTTRLASEKTGKDRYHQIHLVTFTLKSGGFIEVITVNDASNMECSMSDVEVFVISKRLGK